MKDDRGSSDTATHIITPTTIEQTNMQTEETEVETPKMAHDSMVTVRLSEPPSLTLDTKLSATEAILPDSGDEITDESSDSDSEQTIDEDDRVRKSRVAISRSDTGRSLQDELGQLDTSGHESDSSGDIEEVNWEQLEKTEDEQTKDDEADNSTALLLARLEQENAKLATNPKTVKVQAVDKLSSSKPRPPSMAQLRQMVSDPAPSALRYSMLPPPAMTDLEFYAALVKDYKQTAARLPTLLTNKLRKGIPPPLRGVVWQSMSGARDANLEQQYDQFSGESSPYELIIGKDLGRSFPGVDMFREADGEGQRMLGRVLKCFSLYDTKIGYCQGLAFIVGPLLMHMPDKQAFCVLVRLMEQYDLRACFLPDLSGLHVRIYQFRELLRINLPTLSAHLEELQVEPAYVSQWFLSFFAVTCPLPMLFRIYDVLLAEGASETLMRVALSLMRKNESRLLACAELEDAMQLLLSRGLWDCYHYDADDFVQDFASLSGAVTREKLSQLEQGYKDSLVATANVARASDITTAASRFLGRIWAASSSSSSTPAKTGTLTPGLSAPGRPFSILKRTASKQSLTSTLNSVEASSISATSSMSTEETALSRDSTAAEDGLSSRESTPVGPKNTATAKHTEDRYLHSQIEDLLTALSEMQRDHTLLSNQLQREREEREEDRRAVRSLLDGLRQRANTSDITQCGLMTPDEDVEFDKTIMNAEFETEDSAGTSEQHEDAQSEDSEAKTETEAEAEAEPAMKVVDEASSDDQDDTEAIGDDNKAAEEETNGATPLSDKTEKPLDLTISSSIVASEAPSTEDLSELLDRVESRFAVSELTKHRSSMMMTKSQLREELAHAKGELADVSMQCQDLNRRIYDMDQEMTTIREQLRERHGHVRTLHEEKQKLEKQMQNMKTRASAGAACETRPREPDSEWAAPPGKGMVGGLREFKLGRSRSTPSTQGPLYNKRISSMPAPHEVNVDGGGMSEHEALLLELVQSKTAEATAKQEAEEAKQKLEALRKAHGGVTTSDSPSSSAAGIATGAIGVFSRLAGQTATPAAAESSPKAAASNSATVAATVTGTFWGWRR